MERVYINLSKRPIYQLNNNKNNMNDNQQNLEYLLDDTPVGAGLQLPPSSGQESNSQVYTVRHNDSLMRISVLTGVSVKSIKKTNNLVSDVLLPG
jgi:LysM repeat protein